MPVYTTSQYVKDDTNWFIVIALLIICFPLGLLVLFVSPSSQVITEKHEHCRNCNSEDIGLTEETLNKIEEDRKLRERLDAESVALGKQQRLMEQERQRLDAEIKRKYHESAEYKAERRRDINVAINTVCVVVSFIILTFSITIGLTVTAISLFVIGYRYSWLKRFINYLRNGHFTLPNKQDDVAVA